jgi:hypothetical protein
MTRIMQFFWKANEFVKYQFMKVLFMTLLFIKICSKHHFGLQISINIRIYILKQQCLSVWCLSVCPCGASPDVTSPDVTDSREKRNQGQSDFLRQKIW